MFAVHAFALAAPIKTATDAADRNQRRIITAFTNLVATLRTSIKRDTDPMLLSARVGDLFRGSGLAPNVRSLEDELRHTYEAGAEAGMYALRRVRAVKSVPMGSVAAAMSFSVLNPSAVSFLQGYSFDLITGLSLIMQDTVRAILTRAYRDGLTVQQQSRLLREFIGLTPAQYAAVENYRRMLEAGDAAALERQLRDARFDRTLTRLMAEGGRPTRAQIERLVQRYTERQLRYRAEMIARTETIRAANAGQIEAWRQAQQQGWLSNTVRMQWIVTRDERTCKICPQIPGLNPGGVPIGGAFQSPVGLVRQPPDPHPQCRCSLGLLTQ